MLKEQIANRFPKKKPSPDNIIINVRSNHYVEIELDDGVGTVKIGKGRIEIIDNELVKLRNVAVKQPLQSCGIGTIILDFLLTACKKVVTV